MTDDHVSQCDSPIHKSATPHDLPILAVGIKCQSAASHPSGLLVYQLDRPVADLTTNGHQQTLEEFKRKAGKRTLREAIAAYNSDGGSVEIVGALDDLAAQMDEAMQAAGGDGFLFSLPDLSRRTLAEIEDGLIPALQRRGLVRAAYAHAQFRDNLLDF